jgi:LuxR family maltose regulon positive regulatory protein
MLFLYLLSGRLIEADHMARFNLSLFENSQLYLTRAWAHYLLGFLRYEWNQLEEAIYHFNKAMELRYHFQSRVFISNAAGLILAYHALGLTGKADDIMALIEEFVRNERHPSLLGLVHSLKARLSLNQGYLSDAISLSNSVDPSALNEPLYYLEVPRLTKVKILLAQGTQKSLGEAEKILNNLMDLAETTHLIDGQIRTLSIHAVLKWQKNQNKEALKYLTRALELGRHGNYIRSFLDLGQPMVSMLQQLNSKKTFPDYVNRILSAFTYQLYPSGSATGPKLPGKNDLIESLTRRETEILALLDYRLSNKEIAQKLFISPQTVQKHTFNIYQKLQVHDRRHACIRARELGILTPRSYEQ